MEWPFTTAMTKLDAIYADTSYQRPPQDTFVDKLVKGFDPQLVGVIDVAQTDKGYAVMDGLQRTEAIRRLGEYREVPTAIHFGLTLEDQARFFLKRNRDRRTMHPYYNFRARVVANDGEARKIDAIIKESPYKLGTFSRADDVITAVKACEDAFGYTSTQRAECLSPALATMHDAFFGRERGKEGEIIRGLGMFHSVYNEGEFDHDRLVERLAAQGPTQLLGLTHDRKLNTRKSKAGRDMAIEIATTYNRGLSKGKLNLKLIN